MGVPRLVGIEHPPGVSFGRPGDVATQTAILRDTLRALEEMGSGRRGNGEVRYLPYRWTELPGDPPLHANPPPPIAQAIMRRPWYYRKLLKGDIPGKEA